jgi:hypothetical protein
MPNLEERRRDSDDELEIVARVMETVERQIGGYRMALEKVRLARKEFSVDKSLAAKVMNSPEEMSKFLTERGVPEFLAVGMAAEDFKSAEFAGAAGIWTWDCCCTSCCLTSCHCTLITSIGAMGDKAQRV